MKSTRSKKERKKSEKSKHDPVQASRRHEARGTMSKKERRSGAHRQGRMSWALGHEKEVSVTRLRRHLGNQGCRSEKYAAKKKKKKKMQSGAKMKHYLPLHVLRQALLAHAEGPQPCHGGGSGD
jgi:hypothetical protein